MASDNTITDLILRPIQSKPDNAHSFFGTFPREIRDDIYDLLFQEKEHDICKRTNPLHADYYTKTRTTLPKVRLVCSQMKNEYDERDTYHLPKNTFRVCNVREEHYCEQFDIRVPTLAVRTTVLHLDLECCGEAQDPEDCLLLTDRGIGGSNWLAEQRLLVYTLADLPLLEKMCFHVNCAAASKRAADIPSGHPPAESNPMLVQISILRTEYVQDLSQSDSIRSDGHKLRPSSFPSPPGHFLVRLKTQAIWTHVNGWNNEAMLNCVRQSENCKIDDGYYSRWRVVRF
jgi:hypothetical protein